MTNRTGASTKLLRCSSALSALVPLSALLITAPAMAQEAASPTEALSVPESRSETDAAETPDIVVTGSLIRRTNAETPSPVTVLSAQSLEERGLNTVAEALQRISTGNAGTMTQGWNAGGNFAAGANAIALRGLTVQATLSAFDGLRMAPYPLADDGQRNFVDLNTIPNAIIDRIEVLRDGASSTYGADAVAGVINIITKKEIKGLHLNASAGISQRGDAGEQRFDVTYGYGDLAGDGFNFYVSGEYLRQEPVYAADREYPFNTGDWSRICNASGACLHTNNGNGQNPDGTANALVAMPGVALVRPVTAPGSDAGSGRYTYLNPALGCGRWRPVQLTAAQLDQAQGGSPTAPADGRVCEVNLVGAYGMLLPDVERFGVSTRFTAQLGENHQLYVQGNYYQTATNTIGNPRNFRGQPTDPTNGARVYNVIAPVYVCPTGVGTLNGLNTGCNAQNGVLNPYNPFAAAGQTAQLLFAANRPTTDDTVGRSLRGVIGLSGGLGGGWDYTADFTVSSVQLDREQGGYPIPQRLMNALARGMFNFANPDATTPEAWDYIMPLNRTHSTSDLWQATASLSKSLFELPGGPLQTVVGAAYRHESIVAPSGNPANIDYPYDRYYGINAVGTTGSRNVFSAFGEIDAPIVKQVEVNLSGRYDSYSTGQSAFSPKVGAKFTPVREVALRGTWSKGFRIPSFNEAFGTPTTGFVQQGGGTFCQTYAAFCATHQNNAYASNSFSVGLTNIGNPKLRPERSESITMGAIFEPIRNVSFTVDLWRIRVRDQIVGVSDIGPVIEQYYANNGVVNIPGYTVTQGIPDQANPNALPHIGTVASPYLNANRQIVQGVDLGVNARFNIADGIKFISAFEASYLDKNHLTLVDQFTGESKEAQEYEGTLSPCNNTSCSGSPQWRASWQNTVDFGNTVLSATVYYTSGYDVAMVDYGGVPGDCESALDAGAAAYDDGTPAMCRSKPIWNLDLTASHRVSDNFSMYANVLNLLDTEPPFDPNAAYGGYGYNPAWAGANIMGRYFRVGVKMDF